MSASSGDLESSRPDYAGFHAPCLHMTSTGDASPIGRTEIRHRRVPFDSIRGPDQFLVIFRDGDHMIFSDHRIGPDAAEKAPPSAGPAGLGGRGLGKPWRSILRRENGIPSITGISAS